MHTVVWMHGATRGGGSGRACGERPPFVLQPKPTPTSPPPTHPTLCSADWKACAVSKEEEGARCERFKEAFRPYDIMDS